MQEITKLSINRKQLKEKFFYSKGCETDNINDKEKIAVNDIINYASDVLIDILLREKS